MSSVSVSMPAERLASKKHTHQTTQSEQMSAFARRRLTLKVIKDLLPLLILTMRFDEIHRHVLENLVDMFHGLRKITKAVVEMFTTLPRIAKCESSFVPFVELCNALLDEGDVIRIPSILVNFRFCVHQHQSPQLRKIVNFSYLFYIFFRCIPVGSFQKPPAHNNRFER